ncbi:MAG: DUF58 domain-containing protein [Verrucomicrobiota bacterium]
MMRFSYRCYLWATALNYHLPRRLTKGGLLAGAAMILLGAIGSDMDQSVAFQGFALLLGLFTVSAVTLPFFRGRFGAVRHLPRLASVDQAFRYRVELSNMTSRPVGPLEWMEDLLDARPTYQEFVQLVHPPKTMRTFRLAARNRPRMEHRAALTPPAPLPPLAASSTVDAQMEVVPLRRGPLRFRGVSVARRDPLGLMRAFVRVDVAQTVLVLPKRYPLPSLLAAGARNYQPGGVSLASSIGESEEFVALRDYRAGDPFRRIHWRSWARAGRPIVKECQDEYFVRHALVLDTFAGFAQLEAFEAAISVAASFACTLETQESLLDLLFVGSKAFTFTAGRSLGNAQQILEMLASIEPSRQKDFTALSQLVLRHASMLSTCICVFIQWDDARRDLVRRLRACGLPLTVLVIVDEQGERQMRPAAEEPALGRIHVLKPAALAEGLRSLEGSLA